MQNTPSKWKLSLYELEDGNEFDPSSLIELFPFTQTNLYFEWKKASGNQVRSFLVKSTKEVIAFFQITIHPLPFGRKFGYIPHGPVVKSYDDEVVDFILNAIYDIAIEEGLIFVRTDFYPVVSKEYLEIKDLPLKLSATGSSLMQPRKEWVIPVGKSAEAILAEFPAKTRYSVRKSAKDGVKIEFIEKSFISYFDEFYRLMQETSERGGFKLHPECYYSEIFSTLRRKKCFLVVASHDSEILIISLVTIAGKTAHHVFSCSSNTKREHRPGYLAHYETLHKLSTMKIDYLNLGGISDGKPNTEGLVELTKFKQSFGGFEINHSELLDVVVKKNTYLLYILAKRLKSIKRDLKI